MVKTVELTNVASMRAAVVDAVNTVPKSAVSKSAVSKSTVPMKAPSMSTTPRGAAPGRPRRRNAGRRRCPVLALIRRLTASLRARGRETGSITAEYAIGTVVACTFAAVLYKIVTSQAVANLLAGIIRRALGSVG